MIRANTPMDPCWIRRVWIHILVACSAWQAVSGLSTFSCEGKNGGDYSIEPCSKNYVTCSNGESMLRQCPDGLYFDPQWKACNWDRNIAECRHLDPHCPAGDGSFPESARECSPSYRRCKAGRAEVAFCSKGEVFDPASSRCVTASGKCTFCSSRVRGRYPAKEGCSDEYYECTDDLGPTTVEKCAKPWAFSPETKLCAPKSDIPACRSSPSKTSDHGGGSAFPPAHVPTKPRPVKPKGDRVPCYKAVGRGRCSPDYQACHNGLTVDRRCSSDRVFYEPYGGCVAKWNSPECSSSMHIYASRCSHSPNAKLAKERCSAEYVQCLETTPVRQWCPPGKVFDESSESCVDITDRPVCMASHDLGTNEASLPRDQHVVKCSEEEKQLKRRLPVGRCSNTFLQCGSTSGDRMLKCQGQNAVYDEVYDRCVPSELSHKCRQADSRPFSSVGKRRKRYVGCQSGMCGRSQLVGVSDALVSPQPAYHYGCVKGVCMGGQAMRMDGGAVVANLDGLPYQPPVEQQPSQVQFVLPVFQRPSGNAVPFMPHDGQIGGQIGYFDPGQSSQSAFLLQGQFLPVHQSDSQVLDLQDMQMSSHQSSLLGIAGAQADRLTFDQLHGAGPHQAAGYMGQAGSEPLEFEPIPAGSLGSREPQQEDFCSGRKDGVYSLGKCKTEYAICRSMRQLLLSCPAGQVFDPKSTQCEDAAGCSTQAVAGSGAVNGTEFNQDLCLNKANGVYAITSCSRFYFTCFNGQYRLMQCPFGEVFSLTDRRCSKDVETCPADRDAAAPPVENYAGTSMPQFCTGSFETWSNCANTCQERFCGQTAAPSAHCKSTCSPGCVCRPGYVRLSRQSRICVPQDACRQYSLTQTALEQSFCNDRPNGLYPYPGQGCVQQYMVCEAGVMSGQTCAAGMVFDAVKAKCVSQGSCTASGPSVSGLDVYFCQGKPDGAYNLPGKTCFNMYYTCSNGAVAFSQCPSGEVFDLHTGCVATSRCDDGPQVPIDVYCMGKRDGMYAFSGYKCFPLYYVCKKGQATFAICQSATKDLVFNGKGCVQRSACLPAPSPTPTMMLPVHYESPFGQANAYTPNFCANQPDGAYPIVECTAPYLVCINSVTTIQYCYPGEVFARVRLPSGLVYQCTRPQYTFCMPRYTYPAGVLPVTTPAPTPASDNDLCANNSGQLFPLTNDPCGQQYINCTRQEFTLQQCPFKFVFNASAQKCVANFDCLSNPPNDFGQLCTGRANGFYMFTRCSPFYVYCQNGVGWIQSCLNVGWSFNGQSMQCAPRQQVPGCGGVAVFMPGLRSHRPVSTAMARSQAPGPLDVRCQTLGDGGYEISACQSDYILCNMGIGDVRSCDRGLVFSGKQQRCVPVDQVSSCTTQRGDSLCQGKANGAYPFGPCEQEFYVCWRQFSYVQKCSGEQIFHSQLQTCVDVNTVPACLAGPKEPLIACSTPGRWASGSCQTSFNLCTREGRLITVHCGEGEAYDRKLAACVSANVCEVSSQAAMQKLPLQEHSHLKQQQDEGERQSQRILQVGKMTSRNPVGDFHFGTRRQSAAPLTTAMPTVGFRPGERTDSAPTAGPDSFCLDKADGFYRHPYECSQFIQCFRRRTFVLHCASGLVFNPKVNVCDFARSVPDCNVVESKDGKEDQTIGARLCAAAKHGSFVRDPTSCKAYYRCVHDRAYRFDCPDTLVFNPKLSVCDFPTNSPECAAAVAA